MLVKNLETPTLIVDMDALERNMRLAQDLANANGFALRPHYKSHKSADIARWQIDAGAKGITCAKLDEAWDLAEAGIEDILIANQIIDPAKLVRAASLAKCCHLVICVDNAENIDALEKAAALFDATVYVMVEYDIGMGRCGTRNFDDFISLAKRIDAQKHLVFEGIQAYAGQLSHEIDARPRAEGSMYYERELQQLKRRLLDAGLSVNQVSGASTGTIGLRGPDTVYTEVEVGTYLFMDTSYDQLQLPFENSLFLLTSVISLAGGLIITDAGCKSLGMDQTPAVFREFPDAAISFSEEHSAIPAAGRKAKIGEQLHLIPGHSCTTINMHDFLYLTRGDKVVGKIPVTSRGRSR